MFSTFFFTLILYQYYNATVVSTLLREPPRYIRTLDDLLKSDLKIGIQDVVFNYDLFRVSHRFLCYLFRPWEMSFFVNFWIL